MKRTLSSPIYRMESACVHSFKQPACLSVTASNVNLKSIPYRGKKRGKRERKKKTPDQKTSEITNPGFCVFVCMVMNGQQY